jgi:iron complex outermembrane receptor protein
VAEDFNAGVVVQNETTTAGAWNYQGGVVYRMSNTGDVHATVSSRTRFPTVFERYSTRFGMATPNPDLDPERSTNYEIGATETLFKQARISGAVFYSDLKDAIQSVYLVNNGRITSQNQNIDGEHYGFEVSVDWDIAPGLRLGGNYTYLQREYGYLTPGTQPEGTPDHEAFLYLAWEATRNLTITPSLTLASDRYAVITSGTNPTDYIKTGAYALANLQAEYKFTENASAAIGVTNIFDEDYALAEGFPEPGRQFFANARMKF